MLRVAVGHSDDPDSQEAISEVLDQCINTLGHGQAQAGLLFAAIDFDHGLILRKIHETYPQIELVGCTTDGEMSSMLGFRQDSLSLIVFASDSIAIRAGLGRGVQAAPVLAAKQAIEQATKGSDDAPKLCITLPASYNAPGETTNGELILQGLNQALGGAVPVIGGLAGDQWRFEGSFQFFNTQVLTDSLPVLTFSGELLLSYNTGCGLQTIGPKGIVTKSTNQVLYEIDGQSAMDFYRQYLGDRPPNPECPLAVYEDNSERYYIRNPNLHDDETGSITFLGNVPQGAVVQLTEVNRNQLVSATEKSMQTAISAYPGTSPDAALLFSCCCRRWLLGTRSQEEYQRVSNLLPEGVAIAGFYTYGEFSPISSKSMNYFHQETFVTLLMGVG